MGVNGHTDMSRLQLHIAELLFTPRKRIRLPAWSGVYAGKIIYDSLSAAGFVLEKGGLFRVTPIYHAESGTPTAGALVPGERYKLRVIIWGRAGETPSYLVARALAAGITALKEIDVEKLRVEEKTLEAPPASLPGEEEPAAAVLRLRHGPSFYRFHGAVISYPSPWRMIASITRRLAEATGQDYRPLAAALQPCIELALDNTRKIWIRITHGKKIKVFMGEARYHLACSREAIERIIALAEVARFLGLGGSPGLGLGEVQEVTVEQPRHDLPPRLEPFGSGDPLMEERPRGSTA